MGRAAGTTTLGSWKTTGTSFWAREVFGNDITVTNTNTPWTNIGYQAYVWTVPTSGAKTVAAVSDVTVTGKSVAVNTAETTTITNCRSAFSKDKRESIKSPILKKMHTLFTRILETYG